MFFFKQSKMAKELAEDVLNIFKTGLFDKKYHRIGANFPFPDCFFQDKYIAGFIYQFVISAIIYRYNKEEWSSDYAGGFVLKFLDHLPYSNKDKDIYIEIFTGRDRQKLYEKDNLFLLGKEHSRLCSLAIYEKFLFKDDDSPLFFKAKKITSETQEILENKLPFQVVLERTIFELTIYDYLQKNFLNL